MEEEFFDFCENITDPNLYPECFEGYEMKHSKTVPTIFLSLLIILCVVGNGLVCLAFLCYRRVRVLTHYYVFSLAVGDLIVGLVAMPIWLSYEITGWMSVPESIDLIQLSFFMEFIDILSCTSSIVNLAAISIDRFFGIVKPLQHKTFVTKKMTVLFIFIAWMYSITIAALRYLPGFTGYIIFWMISGYLIPCLSICFSYSFIFLTVKRHAKRRMSNQLSKEWTIAKTIAIVISLLVFCWTPFLVVCLLWQYCLSCNFEESWFTYLHHMVKWLHYFSSCCNPFIYGVFNVKFRTAFKAIAYRCLGLISKEYNANAYENSLNRRFSSIRQRSITVNSALSYTDSQRSPLISIISNEPDDLPCSIQEKVRTFSFKRSSSSSSIIRLPKPLTPTKTEVEPRFTRQPSIPEALRHQDKPRNAKTKNSKSPEIHTHETTKIFDQIAQAFSSEVDNNLPSLIDNQCDIKSKHTGMGDDNFAQIIQKITEIEIDSLLADAKESKI